MWAAGIQPSTCSGERAPTIAPLTPGHDNTQAMAIALTVVSWRAAIGFSASRNAMFRSSCGDWNSGRAGASRPPRIAPPARR